MANSDVIINVDEEKRKRNAQLSECAATTRRACEQLIQIIDAGEFAQEKADDMLRWLYIQKGHRALIVNEIMRLHGTFDDRSGAYRRKT